MNYSMLHTPEGVRDIYNEEIEKHEIIISKLKKLVKSYGFDNIKTPTFEFLSVYYKDITLKRPKDLYKFFDAAGNTLVLRPDFTPSIARAASKYFTDERVRRLFYEGNVFSNNKRYQGRLKETFQFGGELIGDGSIGADAEIIAIVVNALKLCGLNDFIISIGHANIIKELIRLGGFDDEAVTTITGYISNRNVTDLTKFLVETGCNDSLIKLFSMCNKIYKPSSEAFNELLDYSKDYDTLHNSLQYLSELADVLALYGVSDYISFEPGSTSEFEYYTGIIFAGYTAGIGECVATGGRYDSLLANFGEGRPAIGFGIFIEELITALDKQNIILTAKPDKTVILYKPKKLNEAVKMAQELRSNGEIVELVAADNYDVEKLYEGENINITEID